MQRVEQKLEIAPAPQEASSQEIKRKEVFTLIERLAQPELCVEERLGIVEQLRCALNGNKPQEHSPPKEEYEVVKVRNSQEINGSYFHFLISTTIDLL
jgi:hypothetical protein